MIKKIRKKIRKCECGKIAVGVISVLRGHKYVCQECAEKSGLYVDYCNWRLYDNSAAQMRREKYPKDRKLRYALGVVLSRKNYRRSYISLLLGYGLYSLDSMERHFLLEHCDPELTKVFDDDDEFRKREVEKHLEQYKAEIEQFLLATNDKRRCRNNA